ncbi:hypothetical protein BX600DRAFT_555388 [Xylariales sp. PMI_506]|nr:hypothetical protein BX600DRAFT_555388 [Xylariales sp. PMI_506]
MMLIKALVLAAMATAAPNVLVKYEASSLNLTDAQPSTLPGDYVFQGKSVKSYECNAGFSAPASAGVIDQATAALRTQTNDCGLEPNTCTMLACSYNAAIQWCNRNDHYASWKCSDFATDISGIRDSCSHVDPFTVSEEVWGVATDLLGFEVWIGYSPC